MKSTAINAINYKEWLKKDKWTDAEAACLLSQIDPKVHITIEKSIYDITRITNNEAQLLYETISTWKHINKRDATNPFWYINKAIHKRISIPELLLNEIKYHCSTLFTDEQNKFIKNYDYIAREIGLIHQLENLNHSTPLLELQKETIKKFWENYDPSRPPKQEVIISWLEEKGVSQREAKYIDSIIRPPQHKLGGQRKSGTQK